MGSGLDIANTGQIRFRKTSPDSCIIKLTISYEVPDLLGPFAEVRIPSTVQLSVGNATDRVATQQCASLNGPIYKVPHAMCRV